MRKLLALIVLVSGCAALNRLNTFKYAGIGDCPTIKETSMGTIFAPTGFGTQSGASPPGWDVRINKQVEVFNPLDKEVEVTVTCSSMMQGDIEFSVPPHSSCLANVETTRWHQYDDTCEIARWEIK